jgi:uncharacterized protein YegP (UPF0339 family)
MAHKFLIKKNKAGEFVAYFTYNSETIFWTEGYASKASAKNAIESIKKNGPRRPTTRRTSARTPGATSPRRGHAPPLGELSRD